MKTNPKARSQGRNLKGRILAALYAMVVAALLASFAGSTKDSKRYHLSGATRLIRVISTIR